jgi:RNA polymerase sigma factor (TIGR02999 family)
MSKDLLEYVPVSHDQPPSVTVLLSRMKDGDRDAFNRLMPLVYQDLHRIAEAYLRRESENHTLQPTALIHEAYLRLVEYSGADYQNRKHFFAIAARVMRRILVDHARARYTAKRGAGATVAIAEGFDHAMERDRVVLSLDEALTALVGEDEPKARMVEMRFFGGMTAQEIADCTSTPIHIVRRELRTAQAWLRQEIER